MTMTTKYTKQEVVDFFHDIFNPIGDDLIDVKAYDIMGQYLTQIEQELENQSMTQKQLAEKIGTSASYISQFFNLNKLINLKTLAKIELALGIDFELKQPTENNSITQIGKLPDNKVSDIAFTATNESPYVAAA
ncbi:MAG: helix-turn-helix transcriptional regulator [Candidatus Thioglobus sp.]|nr:MAG: helix-turn-helix transcriptional regulator [Candidatus Thioglobus sp.]